MMKSKPCRYKVVIVMVIGIILVVALGKTRIEVEKFFVQKNKIVKTIDIVKHNELMLNYTISASSISLYKSNDAIVKSLDKLEESTQKLLDDKYFKDSYPEVHKQIVEYKKLVDLKIQSSYEFQTYSSAMKNSIMYISMLLKKLPTLAYNGELSKNKNHFEYVQNFMKIVSKIFLSKNSLDKNILKDIGKDINYFKTVKLKNKYVIKFNNMFLAHLNVYSKYYPVYNKFLFQVLDKKTQEMLDKIDKNVYEQAAKKLEAIEYLSFLIMFFIALYTILVIVLILKVDKENLKLNNLTDELYNLVRTDSLTQLDNRHKFDEDIEELENKILFLVNIDKFKHINNYYGSKIGDKVLKDVAKILKNIISSKYNARFYRLGADDFGILMKKDIANKDDIVKTIIEYFEKNELDIEQFRFKISVSIGINNQKPYLEKANIALKEVKNTTRSKYVEYTQQIDNKDKILKNIEKTKKFYNALKENRVVPYFQPIIDVKSGELVKYEVLSRVIADDGFAESIYPYLDIAKENKLYSNITQIVLEKSVEKFKDTDIKFNVNFSIEDIMDQNIMNLIEKIKDENPKIMKNITFELLESESINDYDIIKNFITKMKSYGSKIAIDDFGSGYSNFDHIINLDIDYLKIDGSLIKNITTNESSYNIVKLVNQFAIDSGIETVGEFVEDEEIYNGLKELNITYAQGYYFGKAEALD